MLSMRDLEYSSKSFDACGHVEDLVRGRERQDVHIEFKLQAKLMPERLVQRQSPACSKDLKAINLPRSYEIDSMSNHSFWKS